MSLSDAKSIDIVLGPTPHAKCTLIAVDSEDHANETQRFEKLRVKLLAYLNYIFGPQFAKAHPGVDSSDVLIGVICKNPPDALMREMTAIQPHADPHRSVRVAVVHSESGKLPWFVVPAAKTGGEPA
jgi:hypothetical protein